MTWAGLRRHWGTALFVVLSLGYLGWLWAKSAYGLTPCPEGVQRHAVIEATGETCPSVGRMNGVKLAVPQHYLLGPKGYKGVDIWNAESWAKRPKTNSFDNEWDNFAIRLRLTNFKPIETFKDKADYGKLGSIIGPPPPENRWIHVGIRALDKPYTFENTVRLWLKDDAKRGPFTKQADEWSLKHYLSEQPLGPRQSKWEFLYDEAFSTFLSCERVVLIDPPHTPGASCQLSFSLPDIQASIEIDNFGDRSDLARWPEIQSEVLRVLRSFIVP